jgi:hypothetical protein
MCHCHQHRSCSCCPAFFRLLLIFPRYKKLLYALTWFHSILLERRKFKSLGFAVPYEFNDSDYEICHDIVIVFLDEYALEIALFIYPETFSCSNSTLGNALFSTF